MRRFAGGQLVVATHNAGKLAEISALLAPFAVVAISAADLGLTEPDETEATFAGNARIKAHFAARCSGLPSLADDSGIEIDGLCGAPGVYTADWAETPTGRDFGMAMAKTWANLETVGAPFPRTARFCCTLVLAWPDGHDDLFAGTMAGQVIWPPRGDQGHGYDPIFQPNGYSLTFGQMDSALKNRISHRADAFHKLVAGCFQ